MVTRLVELTQVREAGDIEVRLARAAEHRRKVSSEWDIMIRSETRDISYQGELVERRKRLLHK
mgnify:CR=1 FL=1